MRFADRTGLEALVADRFGELVRAPGSERRGWGLRFTEPLPEAWPAPTGFVVFAYAAALPIDRESGRLMVIDGESVAAPFATLSLRRDEPVAVSELATSLQSAGTQGVRPLGTAEVALYGRQDEVYAELETFPAILSDLARAYYRQWLSTNGVIAGCLPAAQQRFFASLPPA